MNYLSNTRKSEIETDENDFDVVIVGAGLSGLSAANKLVSAGLNTLVVDKNEFPGGRLLSAENSESFYAHESQYYVSRLIGQFNLSKKLEKFPESREIIHCKLDTLENGVPFYVIAEIYYFIKILDGISKNDSSTTMQQNINFTNLSHASVKDILHNLVFFKKSRALCQILIYVTCGTHQLETISALWYIRMLSCAGGFLQRLRINLGDNNRYYIQGGAIRIAELLSNKIQRENKIHYDEEVDKIQFNEDRAHVWSRRRHYKCYYVILAVPFTNDCKIAIEPELHSCAKDVQIESKNIFFNAVCEPTSKNVNKVKNILIRGRTDESFTSIYNATCSEDRKLHFSGFSSGTQVHPLKIIEVINKSCACRMVEFKNISDRSFMNVFKPNNFKHNCWLMKNHGRIIFAGSEYATHWPGTIDGAIESGEFAAFSILQRLRPQAMQRFEWSLSKGQYDRFTNESKAEISILHTICFWINVFLAVSFLRTAFISLIKKH